MQAREGHVEVIGGRIWYRMVGDTDATPLVTVHGGPGATRDYLEPLQALADVRPVVFYDQLGAGKSERPTTLTSGQTTDSSTNHEAVGTTDAEEYQTAYMEYFCRRHVCRLDPWPDAATRTFTQLNQAIYQRMQGPNEMCITGIHKGYDITDRLGQLSVPTLFVCGRHGSTRPEGTAWYHSLVPGAELVVFEHSSHLPPPRGTRALPPGTARLRAAGRANPRRPASPATPLQVGMTSSLSRSTA